MQNDYTIDQLAVETGVPTRTIRFYQARGVLPAPARRGRVAMYGDDHVERLRLVAQMQERGLRLRAIKDVFAQVELGELSIEDWLGLGEKLQTPWSEDSTVLLTEQELRGLTGQASLEELERLGWVEAQAGTLPRRYVVRSPGLLRIAAQMGEAGIDLETAAGAERILRRRLGRAADELVGLFETEVRRELGRGRTAADLAKALDALRPIASDAVRIIFAREIERAVSGLFERGSTVRTPRRGGSASRRSRS